MLDGKKFDVEHAMHMYASSYVTIPALGIYDEEMISTVRPVLETCHIYIIGLMPKINFVAARQAGNDLVTAYEVGGITYELNWPLPKGAKVVEHDGGWGVESICGDRWAPKEEMAARRLNDEHNVVNFEVLYIGQAYGRDGNRNALDRLLKHETLQKISVMGIPLDKVLTVLLLEIVPDNRLITIINPWAENADDGEKRIKVGLDKLFETDEVERITLYEASLIRYFQPRFNKEFKNSFPSTNLKVLADCYNKDFSAIVSEICIDELPYKLFSKAVTPSQYHIAKFDLHDDQTRKVFFG